MSPRRADQHEFATWESIGAGSSRQPEINLLCEPHLRQRSGF
jgi:hypothetical protein